MKAICTIIFVAYMATSFAQEGPLTKGDVKVNAGIGIGSFLGSKNETATVPPLSISIEYALNDAITIGGIAGYYASEYRYKSSFYSYHYQFTHKLLGARLNYYYDLGEKLDVYGGGGLGYNIVGFKTKSSSSSLDDYDASESGIFYTLHVGGRYNFSKKMGAFAELGYGFTALNLGLTINFNK